MKVSVYKTDKVMPRSHKILDIIDAALPSVSERSVIVVSAKIVSLCEGRAVSTQDVDKDTLIRQEAQRYIDRSHSKYNSSFTITNNVFIPSAGIDESNADGYYILWPTDVQTSANSIRDHLVAKHQVKHVGVIIADSTSRIMQWGTTGIALAHSGFKALNDYAGSQDLFGHEMKFQKSNIANGLAASAVVAMGEGSEQTPIALIEDASFVQFQRRNPSKAELDFLRIAPEDDLFWPIIGIAPWEQTK